MDNRELSKNDALQIINSYMNYPLFTVIIPQKDRAEFLEHTLRTCVMQDYPNFEVIVADDCSDDNSVEVVKHFMEADKRVKLIAHDTHVGMRMNFENALSQVRPGYVMALGGDDGLLPGCIWKMYDIIQSTGAKLLTWPVPGFQYTNTTSQISILSIPRKKFDGVKMLKSKDFLNKIAKSLRYLVDDCPMFYIKGVASTELVDRVKSRTPDHCFYYCPTPDGFSGVVLAGEVDEYAYTNEPLSINGGSHKSQGLNYQRTDKQSRKESEQFFKDSVRKTMHKELASQPYSPLVPLMTADYLLTARDLPGWPGEFEMIPFDRLLEICFDYMAKIGYENQLLVRELEILKAIAKQHGLEENFNYLLKNKKRKVFDKSVIDGFFVTSNVVEFDAEKINIHNIYDAAIAVPVLYNLCNRFGLKEVNNWIIRCIKVLSKSRFGLKKESFPDISSETNEFK